MVDTPIAAGTIKSTESLHQEMLSGTLPETNEIVPDVGPVVQVPEY